jgi:hypothetical protein
VSICATQVQRDLRSIWLIEELHDLFQGCGVRVARIGNKWVIERAMGIIDPCHKARIFALVSHRFGGP